LPPSRTLTGNLIGVDAMLAPLADNGRATKTRAFLAASPACDVGAYEAALVLPSGNYQGLFWRFLPESESG
jgi:hypothetical protein